MQRGPEEAAIPVFHGLMPRSICSRLDAGLRAWLYPNMTC